MEPQGTWDPLGMRGTCSPGFVARREFPRRAGPADPVLADRQRVDDPGLPHPLVARLAGLATDAFDRARAFVKAAAKRKPGEPLPAAVRLSQLMSELSLLRAEVSLALREFCDSRTPRTARSSRRWRRSCASTTSRSPPPSRRPQVCQGAIGVCGIVGYKNDTPFSVGRHLRDSMSACLMVANERIHQTNASLLLIAKEV